MMRIGCRVLPMLLLSVLLVSTVLANSRDRGTWRPYTNSHVLIILGMSKGEVLVKAGEPQVRELVSLGTDGHQNISIWTYIRTGHNAAVTDLRFVGNRLVNIATRLIR